MLRVRSTGERSTFRPRTADSSRSRYSACLTHWRSMASKSSREYFSAVSQAITISSRPTFIGRPSESEWGLEFNQAA